jgi:hypothetical protein
MRPDRTGTVANALLLYGLLAAPLAWAAQLVVGYGIGEAACSPAALGDARPGEAALTAVTAAAALTGLFVATRSWREERRRHADPRGRIEFMATGGVLVSAVFLVLILLGGITAVSISPCRQS